MNHVFRVLLTKDQLLKLIDVCEREREKRDDKTPWDGLIYKLKSFLGKSA